ncbi:hypothetical protein, partial [Mycobacterium uberis]|uniref:hypothetical protein n=1 Tax=Mycobacterium uberis TaxID=2162698 RepID=UPI001FB264B7
WLDSPQIRTDQNLASTPPTNNTKQHKTTPAIRRWTAKERDAQGCHVSLILIAGQVADSPTQIVEGDQLTVLIFGSMEDQTPR